MLSIIPNGVKINIKYTPWTRNQPLYLRSMILGLLVNEQLHLETWKG